MQQSIYSKSAMPVLESSFKPTINFAELLSGIQTSDCLTRGDLKSLISQYLQSSNNNQSKIPPDVHRITEVIPFSRRYSKEKWGCSVTKARKIQENDHPKMQDNAHFALLEEDLETFMEAFEAPSKNLSALKKLMSFPSVFE